MPKYQTNAARNVSLRALDIPFFYSLHTHSHSHSLSLSLSLSITTNAQYFPMPHTSSRHSTTITHLPWPSAAAVVSKMHPIDKDCALEHYYKSQSTARSSCCPHQQNQRWYHWTRYHQRTCSLLPLLGWLAGCVQLHEWQPKP